MDKKVAILLAAGDGTRMNSKGSKVLCKVLFKPMVDWVISACQNAELDEICAVVADLNSDVAEHLKEDITLAVQAERLGTAHAVGCAHDFIVANKEADILILNGDAPFIDAHAINAAHTTHQSEGNAITIVSARVKNPYGYGRIVREGRKFTSIVEQSECDEATAKIDEINSGVYWFKGELLSKLLEGVENKNSKGEYYLTDTVSVAVSAGLFVGVHVAEDESAVLGANNRKALAELNEIARQRVFEELYAKGVDIPITDGVIISPDAVIGRDTVILPGSIIKGASVIGEGCEIGPNTVIEESIIGDYTKVISSQVEESKIASAVRIGPFARIRPKSDIADNAKIGNFVEVKSSSIGEHTSIAHLSYFGDSEVGKYVNVGCGVVTANYDGAKKHKTVVGDGVFIGCNTNLIAPVTLEKGSNVAAGSTITKDVPEYSLAVERATQKNIEGWAKSKGKYKKLDLVEGE